jgi:4-hydroxythreonine-4-phosphate dehydrogenase
MSVRLAITMGDFNGIGPEIILKSLPQLLEADAVPVIIGHKGFFDFYADRMNISVPENQIIRKTDDIQNGTVNFLNLPDLESAKPNPGQLAEPAGRAAMEAVEMAISCCQAGQADAMVTAPISKEAVNKAGYHIPGHTEFLAEKTNTNHFLMLMIYGDLRLGLLSTHIPVSKIAGEINSPVILEKIEIINQSARSDFKIANPRIAVLGLNPHTGDGGMIGREEIDIIQPAIAKAQSQKIHAEGPFSADGFFGSRKYKKYDGVLAMYHDQGMVPFKTIAFGRGVNYTAGLPIVRTSPDHGTAFDIAGTNAANPASFIEASQLAIRLAQNKMQRS